MFVHFIIDEFFDMFCPDITEMVDLALKKLVTYLSVLSSFFH